MTLSAIRREGSLTFGSQTEIYLEEQTFCEKEGSTEDWLHQPDFCHLGEEGPQATLASVSLLCGMGSIVRQ